MDVQALGRRHVSDGYLARSERCRGCVLSENCDGAHINLLRDQGLGMLTPLEVAPEEHAVLGVRLSDDPPLQPPAPCVDGSDWNGSVVLDPLAVLGVAVEEKRKARKAARKAALQTSKDGV